MRQGPKPLVTPIYAPFGFYLPGKVWVQHRASMFHFDSGRCRQLTHRVCHAQGILDPAKMCKLTDLKTALFAPRRRGGELKGLVDDAHFVPDVFGNPFEPEGLQHNNPRGEFHRANSFRAALQVPVEVSAGQSDDERRLRMPLAEGLNG